MSMARQRVLAWLPAGLVGLVLFIASSVPGTSYPQVDVRFADKMVHLVFYSALGAACARGLLRSTAWPSPRLVFMATAMATVFGATDELHQLFVPFRSADWHDLAADALGALLGSLLWALVGRRARPPSATRTGGPEGT
jgi:VanZ family protein